MLSEIIRCLCINKMIKEFESDLLQLNTALVGDYYD